MSGLHRCNFAASPEGRETMQNTFTHDRTPRSFRAILIDPWARKAIEGYLQPELASIYAALSGPGFPSSDEFPTDPEQWAELEREAVRVSCIDIRNVGRDHTGRAVDLICDDEGRLRDSMACFRMGGRQGVLIAGRALLVGSDDEGETCGTALPLFEVIRSLEWLAWDTDYEPEPFTITELRDGESFAEAIERTRRS
jgi:hypothetical protein